MPYTEEDRLWYEQPASNWNEALPLGNGRLGAMLYGGAHRETISLNEDTLWSGYPRTSQREGMSACFQRIRKLVMQGEMKQAQTLAEEEFGDFLVQMYLPFGDITIDMNHQGEVAGYRRELQLDRARHIVTYRCGDVGYTRTAFIAEDPSVLVVEMTADRPGVLDFSIGMEGKLRCRRQIKKDEIQIEGNCPVCTAPFGQTHAKEERKFYSDRPEEQGVGYRGILHLEAEEGSIHPEGERLQVRGASRVRILLSICTSFNGYNRHPVLEGREYRQRCRQQIQAAVEMNPDRLAEESEAAHRKYYDRVRLRLDGGRDELPTDRRLEALQQGEKDNGLYVLLFNYGRYLMIAGSRPGTQPMNLQGIWNKETIPPWSSNYTLNINTEMNYWPALSCHLEECLEPLLRMTRELCENGKQIARQYYDMGGSVVHHATDLWRLAHPSTNLLPGSCQWGFWNFSGGWLCRHLIQYYRYTGDRKFLKQEALPVLREFARFYSEYLVEKEGRLIACPSTSPENRYAWEDDWTSIDQTAAMSMAIIRELFQSYRDACMELGEFDDLYETIVKQIPLLKRDSIGSDGRLVEWYAEHRDVEKQHRHLSHLYPLYPGDEIALDTAPEWAEACRRVLEKRGDEGTGWSLAWKINCWARLGEGDHALLMLKKQLRPVDSENRGALGGSYPNLLCAHPPFQIDGNFGACSGVVEMLLQCREDKVHLLPALPAEWSAGEVKGFCLPGGATIDFAWKEGRITRYAIRNASRLYTVEVHH